MAVRMGRGDALQCIGLIFNTLKGDIHKPWLSNVDLCGRKMVDCGAIIFCTVANYQVFTEVQGGFVLQTKERPRPSPHFS